MKQDYPVLTIADFTVLILLLLSGMFFYVWYVDEHMGFFVLGVTEVFLAIFQYKLNRIDIMF